LKLLGLSETRFRNTTAAVSKIRQKLAVRGFVNKRGENITVDEDYQRAATFTP
jgi:hypothetical protein